MNQTKEFQYGTFTHRKIVYITVGIILCLTALIADVLIGSSQLGPQKILQILLRPESAPKAVRAIIWDVRLPIALMALVVGAALGTSGAAMQTILGNPLASPYTLGLSAGAGFGASFAMVIGLGSLPLAGNTVISLCAFVCALLACGGIYLISRQTHFATGTMVLAGIGMVFFFQAGQSFLQYIASNEALSGVVFWTFGSLSKSDWPKLFTVSVAFLAVFIIVYKNAWKMTALTMGEERAKVLGVNVSRLRMMVFLLISLLTATAVSFVGCIGFVGIVAPHIARILLGEDQRYYLPMSAIIGALLLSCANIAAKSIVPGAVFPIGILTSLIGVPVFFTLIIKKR